MFFSPMDRPNQPSHLRLQASRDGSRSSHFLHRWEAEHAEVLEKIENEILWWNEERSRLRTRHGVEPGKSYSMEKLYPAHYHRVTEPRWWGNTHCGEKPTVPPSAAYLLQPDLTPAEWALFDLYTAINTESTPRSILFSAISSMCTRRAAC